jgi:putative membrane protein
MGWHYGNAGWGAWIAMGSMMVVFWGVLIAVGVVLFRSLRREGPAVPQGQASAQRLLDERFAYGEIDADDYRARSELLKH